jgi:hypothetical protein
MKRTSIISQILKGGADISIVPTGIRTQAQRKSELDAVRTPHQRAIPRTTAEGLAKVWTSVGGYIQSATDHEKQKPTR